MAIVKLVRLSNTSNSHNVDFVSTKKAYTAPKIIESFVDDGGEIIHILENGNTQTNTLYMKMWGQPKGQIRGKNFKGKGLDGRSNWIK